jgi:hypothetical protein
MESILEILKYTIPALVVFLTAYFLLKMHLDDKNQGYFMVLKTEQSRITLPVRMQAYERIAIFIDRIGIPSLIARIRTPEMSVGELQLTLMMAIQQEFDHNVSQQIYVSDTIWKITQLARDGSMNLIDQAGNSLTAGESGEKLVQVLFANLETQNNLLMKALNALRTEAGASF